MPARCSALLAGPQLLIVDEPTAGLDPEERIRFRTLLSQFGRVWSVVTDGPPPAEGTVVSALPHEGGMRYRVVAPAAPGPQARPVEPALEDGYLALTAR